MGRAGGPWRGLLLAAAVAIPVVAGPDLATAQDTTSTSGAPTVQPTSTVADPRVVGPIPTTNGLRKRILTTPTASLADHGYVEQEVFFDGRAGVHRPAGDWGEDGRWETTTDGTKSYRSRMLVRRPVDPAAFNGTVVVSWLDVTASFDADHTWAAVGEALMRDGAAFVAVSAQTAGVSGPLGAVAWDPTRYGALHLTDDALSYDAFSQAAQAIKHPAGLDPLAGLSTDRRLIATGRSQAAQRLITYINAFHPTAQVFDGFLVTSRSPHAAPLGRAKVARSGLSLAGVLDPDLPALPDPHITLADGIAGAQIRDDTEVPVLVVLTETDVAHAAGERQPDGTRLRTWEVAGSAHLDRAGLDVLLAQLARDFPLVPVDQLTTCSSPNTLSVAPVLRAAHRAMSRWVEAGTPPAAAPRIELDDDGEIVRDADGIALGGVRLPELAVPTAIHTGVSGGEGFCALVGSTVAFAEDELRGRYPSHNTYVAEVRAAADAVVTAGQLLDDDATAMVAAAAASSVGGADVASTATEGTVAEPVTVGRPSESVAAAPSGAAAPEASPAPAPASAARSERGWMATTGWQLIAPVLGVLLLLPNGRVVVTVINQRRQSRRY